MIRSIYIFLCLTVMSSQGESLETWLHSLPQVRNVTCSYVSNEDCVLIDVRQAHEDPFTPIQNPSYLPILGAVRNDIIGIGTNLQVHLDLSSYYLEGYTSDTAATVVSELKQGQEMYESHQTQMTEREDERRQAEIQLIQLQNQLKITGDTNKDSLQMISLLKRLAGNDWPGDTNSVFNRYGSGTWAIHTEGLFLAIESGMKPRLTEDSAIHARGLLEEKTVTATKTNMASPEWQSYVMRDRELATLRIIAHDYAFGAVTNHYSLLIYGADHDFTESVRSWNSTNSFKFSLITVTPKSYIWQ